MSNRRFLIAGNWKMNGLRADAKSLGEGVAQKIPPSVQSQVDVLVCPPFVVLETVERALQQSNIMLGAQTCHTAEKGAHTGDISAAMLKDAGCSHVIVGHSERRTDHGETDGDIQAQAIAAHDQDLIAIVCVGETEAERDAGRAFEVVREQILGSVPLKANGANTVIAYEPVWAIGTGKVATPEDVQAMHSDIRNTLADKLGQDEADKIRILYGGSMKPENAPDLLALEDVDGGLIGGAALKAEDFCKIAESCPSVS